MYHYTPPQPPVREGHFIYGASGFEVTFDNPPNDPRKTYPRTASTTLYHICTRLVGPQPIALTKAGKPRKRQPPPIEDEPASSYFAQCLHYGVPRGGSRDKAKANLLAAFAARGGQLSVPDHIIQLEKRLRKQFEAETPEYERKAKIKREEAENAHAKAEAERKVAEKKRMREEQDMVTEVERALSSSKNESIEDQEPLPANYGIVLENFDWDKHGHSLSIAPSKGNTHLWGTFDFGVFQGVFRARLLPNDGTFKFKWRGRDTGTGEMTFSSTNVGELRFLDDAKFGEQEYCCGWISGDSFRKAEIFGKRVRRLRPSSLWNNDVRSWKSEWRTKHEQAYNVESVSRWGKYGGEIKEKVDESDSSCNAAPSPSDSDYESDVIRYEEEF
ncbi:hypothetical protein DFS34DRAFT_615337 [Phlyctochytrium arcticum]|nr:hypothetical protein DFS34DRAFT_615337 [Phlyctochytrium arcticum]